MLGGNVIGGGDQSGKRLIPNTIRSLLTNKVFSQNPNLNRPWQHVLEPLDYLILAKNNISIQENILMPGILEPRIILSKAQRKSLIYHSLLGERKSKNE